MAIWNQVRDMRWNELSEFEINKRDFTVYIAKQNTCTMPEKTYYNFTAYLLCSPESKCTKYCFSATLPTYLIASSFVKLLLLQPVVRPDSVPFSIRWWLIAPCNIDGRKTGRAQRNLLLSPTVFRLDVMLHWTRTSIYMTLTKSCHLCIDVLPASSFCLYRSVAYWTCSLIQ